MEITWQRSPQQKSTNIMDTDNENDHQQKRSHKITKSHSTSTPHPDNNPTSTDQPSILPSIAFTCIRQRQRAGQPKEKLAELLISIQGESECECCMSVVLHAGRTLTQLVDLGRLGKGWTCMGHCLLRLLQAMRAGVVLGWRCACYTLVPYSILGPPLPEWYGHEW